jgi:hypothetical protein
VAMRKLQLISYSAVAFLLLGVVRIAPSGGAIANWLNISQEVYARSGGSGGSGGRSSSNSSSSSSSSSRSSSSSSSSSSPSHSSSSSSSGSSPSRFSSSSPSRSTPVDSTRSGGGSNSNSSQKQSSPAPSSSRPSGGNSGGRVRAGSFNKAPEPVRSAPVPRVPQQRSSGSTTVIRRSVQTGTYPVYTEPSLPYNPSSLEPNTYSEEQPIARPETAPLEDSSSEPLLPNNPAYRQPNSSYKQQPIAIPEPAPPEDSSYKWRLFWFWIFLSGGGVALLAYCIYYQRKPTTNELNNHTVTVSKLQVALLAEAGNIQSLLTELSLNADLETVEGRAEFLQECVLGLLRLPETWTHALASSETVGSREKAEQVFNKFSVQERSKLSVETLSNVNGNIRTRHFVSQSDRETAEYIVVTFLVGTDYSPLFGEIYSIEELKGALERIAAMPPKYLLSFELIWSPQQETDSLSYDKLLASYSDLVQI